MQRLLTIFDAIPVDPSFIAQVTNYVTLSLFIACLVWLVCAFLRGLARGWRYGTYRLVMFLLLIAIALLTLRPIVNAIGNLDLTVFGIGTSVQLPTFVVSINGQSVAIATEGTTAFEIVSGYIANLMKATGSDLPPDVLSAYALTFATSLVSLVLVLVDAFLITIFGTFFVFILWHLAFKRFIPKATRKASYKKGKLWGGFSSLVVSACCISLFWLPLTSVVNSLNGAWQSGQLSEEDKTTLHTIDDPTYQAISSVLDAYDNSVFAEAFFNWTRNNEGKTLDVSLMEFLTGAEMSLGDNEKVSVSFLNELTTFAKAFTIVIQGGVLSQGTFDSARIPLLLTTSMAPELLRTLGSSQLVTGIMPYGLTVLENMDGVAEYVKVGTGIDFSGNYELTFNELADIYDSILDSTLLDNLVDPSTGELGSSSAVMEDVLSEDNKATVTGVFDALDGENLRIFDAVIESALTIQAYKDITSGKAASESELTVSDFLPYVTLDEFTPVDGKPTTIPESYRDIKWGSIFADFFASTVNLVNVSEELYLAVCNAMPSWNGEPSPSYRFDALLEPILDDFEAAKEALVGNGEPEEGEEAVTPLLGTEFILNASPKIVNMLASSVNSSLNLSSEKAIDLSNVAATFRSDQSTILPEFSALLDIVGDFAGTEEGKEFLLHLDAMPGIYFAPDGSFVGIDEGLVEGLQSGLRGLDASLIATEALPPIFENLLAGSDSILGDLGEGLVFDFDVDDVGSELATILGAVSSSQGLISYLMTLGDVSSLKGQALESAVDTISYYQDELVDFLQAVAGSQVLNPVVDGKRNSNIATLLGKVFEAVGIDDVESLSSTLESLSESETQAEMESFVNVLIDVIDSGIVPSISSGSVSLTSLESVSFEEMFSSFDESIIFSRCFGSVIDSLLSENATFKDMIDSGLSFENVTSWREEGRNLDILVRSINLLGAKGLLDGGSIDFFSSDPEAVKNVLQVLSSSSLFVEKTDGGYHYRFPSFLGDLMGRYLDDASDASSFFVTPEGNGKDVLIADIESTALSADGSDVLSSDEVIAAKELWNDESAVLSDVIRSILASGGMESFGDGKIDLASVSAASIDALFHDSASLKIFGRVLNYSIYKAIAGEVSSAFADASDSPNLAAFWFDSLSSYEEAAVPGGIFDEEADAMSTFLYAVLDPETGIVGESGGESRLDFDSIDLAEISTYYLIRPLLDGLSSSRLFNTLGNKEYTTYEYMLSSILEGTLFDKGEGLAKVASVRVSLGSDPTFEALKSAWEKENDAIVNTLDALGEADVDVSAIQNDPMAFFEDGSSYEGQRAKLENVLVAAGDSKIVRPAMVDMVEKAADELKEGTEVDADYLLSASQADYDVEVRRLSFVLMHGAMIGTIDTSDIDVLFENPAADGFFREAATSRVLNPEPGADGTYGFFEKLVRDALLESDYYLAEGEAAGDLSEERRVDAVLASIDGAGDRYVAWPSEVDSLSEAMGAIRDNGVSLSGATDLASFFNGEGSADGPDEAGRDKLYAILSSINDSGLLYPGLGLRFSAAIGDVGSASVDLGEANFYYPGKSGEGLLSARYSSSELLRLSDVVMYAQDLSEVDFNDIATIDGSSAGNLLATMANSRIFNSLSSEAAEGSATSFVSIMKEILSSPTLAPYYFSSNSPKDEELGYLDAEDKAAKAVSALFPEVKDDSGKESNDAASLNGESESSLASIIDYIAENDLSSVLDDLQGGALPSSEAADGKASSLDMLTELLKRIDGNDILFDIVPNAIASITDGGDSASISIEGIDLARSDPFFPYRNGEGAIDSANFTKRYGSEEIGSVMGIADALNENQAIFGAMGSTGLGIGMNEISELRNLLVSLSDSDVFNGYVGKVTAGVSIGGVDVPEALNVFDETLFYIMVDSGLYLRAYDPVIDAETGFVSAVDKLKNAILGLSRDEERSEVDHLIGNDKLDEGLLVTALNELGTSEGAGGERRLTVDFASGSGTNVMDFASIAPDSLNRLFRAINKVAIADGVLRDGVEVLLGDTINLSMWSQIETNRRLANGEESLRIAKISYIGEGETPVLYYTNGAGKTSVVAEDGVYSFLRSRDIDDGEIDVDSSLIGPTDVYIKDGDAYVSIFVYDSDGSSDWLSDNFLISYDASTAHLLTRADYDAYTIDLVTDFLSSRLWDEESESYSRIDNATDFLMPRDGGSSSSLYEIIRFLLAKGSLYGGAFDEEGTFLGADGASLDEAATPISYTSGTALMRNFVKTLGTSSTDFPVNVDLGKVFVYAKGEDAVGNERSLLKAIYSSVAAEANYGGKDREAVYPWGISFLESNLSDVILTLAAMDIGEIDGSSLGVIDSIPSSSDGIVLLEAYSKHAYFAVADNSVSKINDLISSANGLLLGVASGPEAEASLSASLANNVITSLFARLVSASNEVFATESGEAIRPLTMGYLFAKESASSAYGKVSSVTSSEGVLESATVGSMGKRAAAFDTNMGLKAMENDGLSFNSDRSLYASLFETLATFAFTDSNFGANDAFAKGFTSNHRELLSTLANCEASERGKAAASTILEAYFYDVVIMRGLLNVPLKGYVSVMSFPEIALSVPSLSTRYAERHDISATSYFGSNGFLSLLELPAGEL